MTRVEFAYPYHGADGTSYQVDQSADLDDGLAADLVMSGIARKVDAPTPAEVFGTNPPTLATDNLTADEVLKSVGDDVELAAAALKAEKSGKNRKTVIDGLTAITETKEA